MNRLLKLTAIVEVATGLMLIIKPSPMKLKPNSEPTPMKLVKQPLRSCTLGFGVAAVLTLLMTNVAIKAAPHRGGGARNRRGCLPLLLPTGDDGHHPQAANECRAHRRDQCPDEFVREYSCLPDGGHESSRPSQLRHALF